MKKLILCLVAYSLISLEINAQAFNSALLGKMMPAKMKFGDGVSKDVLMKYEPFEYLKFPQHSFTISLTGSEADAHLQTGGIESFMLDGNIWALRTVPGSNSNQFVILKSQGAIENFEYVKYGKPEDSGSAVTVILPNDTRTISVTRKVGEDEIAQGQVPDDKIREWIADSQEVMDDLKNAESVAQAERKRQDSLAEKGTTTVKHKGLMGALEKANDKQQKANDESVASVDMGRIINNYNAWYEQHHTGAIHYQFIDPPTWVSLPKRSKSVEEQKSESRATANLLFADRTSTVSPEMASARDNTPGKKETFTAKSSRIKADGNKIGVWLNLQAAHTQKPPQGMSTMSNQVYVTGEYMDETLRAAGEQFVAELNEAYHTEVFSLINLADIPYREVKVFGSNTRIDDWWATKYKVVFAFTIDPRLDATNEQTSGKTKYAVALSLIQSLIVTEYLGGPGSTKQDILTQIQDLGGFRTPMYSQDAEWTDPKDMYEKALGKLGTPIVEKMKLERADGVKKLVEKRLTP